MSNILGKRLKQLRIDNNKLQKDVANYLNISDVAYGYYEKGERQPNPDMLLKLADFFNVSVDYLLGRIDSYKPLDEPIQIASSTKDNIDLSDIDDEDKKTIMKIYSIIKNKNNDK